MKKILLALIILVMAMPVMAQDVEMSPLTGVVMGSAYYDVDGVFNDGSDSRWGGGAKVGFLVDLGGDRGLYLRTVYNKITVGNSQSTQSMQVAMLIDWYVGKKWSFYINAGGENYLGGGDYTGTDPFAGVGFSRIIWSNDDPSWQFQPVVKMFAEVLMTDSEDISPTGNYAQLNVGFTFSKPLKK